VRATEDRFPTKGVQITHILVVVGLGRARSFYRDILGATVIREYGGTSSVLRFGSAWLLLVTEGGPTEDKPDRAFVPPDDLRRVSHSITILVPDCRVAYEVLGSRGAEFLTPPYDCGDEVRCFFRALDGHLLEISETKR
jgi:catechol 2,3-dioxygenase-like lactoylglutathione lyase family enzyme